MRSSAAVVVVTHEGAGDTVRRCLDSLQVARTSTGPEVTTLVVDNGSGPMVAAHRYGPGVDEVVRVENRGFGAAANAGIRLAAAKLPGSPVAVLNDDVEVDPGWLDPLVHALAGDDLLGAVQPALVYDGTDRVNSLGVELDRYGAGSDIGLGRPVDQIGHSAPIDIFTGGAVLFRRAFLDESGGFDERYFLYYEDVDLALRGRELGWTYRCETTSIVRHRGGVTTDRMGDQRIVYQERNRLWVAARFGSPAMIGRAVWLSVRRLRHEPRGAHARALAAGLAGVPGSLSRRWRQSVSGTG